MYRKIAPLRYRREPLPSSFHQSDEDSVVEHESDERDTTPLRIPQTSSPTYGFNKKLSNSSSPISCLNKMQSTSGFSPSSLNLSEHGKTLITEIYCWLLQKIFARSCRFSVEIATEFDNN